jgi:hypothetical protein
MKRKHERSTHLRTASPRRSREFVLGSAGKTFMYRVHRIAIQTHGRVKSAESLKISVIFPMTYPSQCTRTVFGSFMSCFLQVWHFL